MRPQLLWRAHRERLPRLRVPARHAARQDHGGRRPRATIGSANMDMRSFRLNFEVNVAIYDQAFAADLERIFAEDLVHTRVISERQPGTMAKLAEGACRILAPLL